MVLHGASRKGVGYPAGRYDERAAVLRVILFLQIAPISALSPDSQCTTQLSARPMRQHFFIFIHLVCIPIPATLMYHSNLPKVIELCLQHDSQIIKYINSTPRIYRHVRWILSRIRTHFRKTLALRTCRSRISRLTE